MGVDPDVEGEEQELKREDEQKPCEAATNTNLFPTLNPQR